MEGVKIWLCSQAADFFDTRTQELILRYDKCLNSCGDYVEMRLRYVHVSFVNNAFFSLLVLLTAHRRLLAEWSWYISKNV
jgi:hypothetical protein